jgi:hypothetical protein
MYNQYQAVSFIRKVNECKNKDSFFPIDLKGNKNKEE